MRHVFDNVTELSLDDLPVGSRDTPHIRHRSLPQIGVAGVRREVVSGELPPGVGIVAGLHDNSLGINGLSVHGEEKVTGVRMQRVNLWKEKLNF